MHIYTVYERIYSLFFRKKPRRNPFNFEVHLTDSCNLNCKSCFHFSPLSPKNNYYPLDEFTREFERLSLLFDGEFGWIHLLGGEPLLNPAINDYLDVVGKYVRKGQVDLLTNGILLSRMGEDFYAACKRNNVRIGLTKYPIQLNIERLREIAASHGVALYIFADQSKGKTFCSPNLVPHSKMDYRKNYFACPISNACVTLDHGKLYYCSLPAFVHIYNEAFGPTFDYKEDSISIFDHAKEELLDFLRTPHPFCKYCDVHYRDKHPFQWGRSEKQTREWLKQEHRAS